MLLTSVILLTLLHAAGWASGASVGQAHVDSIDRTTYYLKRGDNHYVTGFHVGAGLDDAVLLGNKSRASRGYLNGTRQLFDLGTDFPWGMVMVQQPGYASRPSILFGLACPLFGRLG
jgi:hypothetical protein